MCTEYIMLRYILCTLSMIIYYILYILTPTRLLTSSAVAVAVGRPVENTFLYLLIYIYLSVDSDYSPGNCIPDPRTSSDMSQIDFGTRTGCCCFFVGCWCRTIAVASETHEKQTYNYYNYLWSASTNKSFRNADH